MAINVNSSFSVGAPVSIDERLVMSLERMLSVNDDVMPEVYLTVCSDDGKLYLYNKANAVIETTGKFRVLEPTTESVDANLVFANHYEFPNVGQPNVLYVAEDENITYRWDDSTQTYVALNEPQVEVIQSIL